MSADNWSWCPVCLAEAARKHAEQRTATNNAYGKVTADEYQRLRNALPDEPPEVDLTLREDYGLGVTSAGKFYVSYQCSCPACGFGHRFKHEEQLTIDAAETATE